MNLSWKWMNEPGHVCDTVFGGLNSLNNVNGEMLYAFLKLENWNFGLSIVLHANVIRQKIHTLNIASIFATRIQLKRFRFHIHSNIPAQTSCILSITHRQRSRVTLSKCLQWCALCECLSPWIWQILIWTPNLLNINIECVTLQEYIEWHCLNLKCYDVFVFPRNILNGRSLWNNNNRKKNYRIFDN